MESGRPLGLGFKVSFSTVSARDFAKSAWFWTEFCNSRSSEVCFCAVASKKPLAAVTESFNAPSGSLSLLIILSTIASVTVEASVSSARSHKRNATKWMVVLASAGSLKDKVAVSRISASFNLESSLEVSNHPLLLSQDWVSFADDTGLGDTAICASRSAQGEKPWRFCADTVFRLLLELWEDV